MAEYPKRPPFFAAKVCKLLGRTCAAQTITPAGAYLITQIAYVEDAKRYSGPVTYFREPLMHITGIGTAARLIRVRNLCVKAGWLHYEEPPKGSRQPGVYWVTIPEKFEDLPLSAYDDEPVAQSNANEYANRTQTDTRIEREPIHESNANQHTFIPIPNPSPNPSPNPPLSPQGESSGEAKPKKSSKREPATVEHYVEAEPSLDSPRLREAIADWLKARRENGKTIFVGQTVTKQAKQLVEFGSQAVAAIEHSIAGGYQGLFMPRGSPARASAGVDVDSLDLGGGR